MSLPPIPPESDHFGKDPYGDVIFHIDRDSFQFWHPEFTDKRQHFIIAAVAQCEWAQKMIRGKFAPSDIIEIQAQWRRWAKETK